MSRTAHFLIAANALLVAVWIALRVLWFDGSIGCDDEGLPQTEDCYRRSDLLASLAWAEITLFAATLAWLAYELVRRRRARGEGG